MSNYPYKLGSYSRTITTSSAKAQVWFDRGLNWTYAYHHEEARDCFSEALQHDASCVMAHWGVAYVVGPNYNRPWMYFNDEEKSVALDIARQSINAANARAQQATPAEQALINALEYRYPESVSSSTDFEIWTTTYAMKMREVYASFPEDRDIVALCAEAMMLQTPWQMWDLHTAEPGIGAHTIEVRAMLERATENSDTAGLKPHPGLLHFYVHLMEMSATPEVALKAADDLRSLVPDAGHLRHMSTHIDVQCGHYQQVVDSNTAAIAADHKYWSQAGAFNFYSLYRVHNYHFKIYGAMLLGQYEAAMSAAKGIHETIPEDYLRQETPPMADWLEAYMGMETHVLVRFGKWQALVDAPLPHDADLYTMSTTMNYYGKGIAHAALGQQTQAESAQREFENAAARVSEDKRVHNVTCHQILGVAREMLAGEIAYHGRQYEKSFSHLRQAVNNEDRLPYDEPWGWMMPSRHALGALLLEQNFIEEAADTYEADLGLNGTVIRSNQHPDNVWALLGLYRCYEHLGRQNDARMIKPRLDVALARADNQISASCFCSRQDVRTPGS